MSIKVLVYAKRSNIGFELKLRISMYVNYVKSDFVVFFCQDKDIIGTH